MWYWKIIDDTHLVLQGGAPKGDDDGEAITPMLKIWSFCPRRKVENCSGAASGRKDVGLVMTRYKVRTW
jgi:hypothetical protein